MNRQNIQTQKISVVMAAYNSEKFISEAIESIINQTYYNWELIIVDDFSTDGTGTIINSFDDNRIIYLKNETNRGAPFSRNKAIEYATGEFLAILDADDYSFPERFQQQVNFLNKYPNIDIVGSYVKEINEKGEIIRYCKYPKRPIQIICSTFFVCSIVHSTAMIRRNFFISNNLFYDETFSSSQDYELWSRAVCLGNIYNIPKFLSCYRYSESQISSIKKEEQKMNAQRITSTFIKKLGLEKVENLLKTHSVFINQCTFDKSIQSVDEIIKWAVLIYEANKKTKLFPVRPFANELILRFLKFNRVNKFSNTATLKNVLLLNLKLKSLFFPYLQLFFRLTKMR
ncbi:MAG: glycosyltransferase [Bacteroidales bacterium]|jgi:glycosyltransferase involved in cell wall biosynthesis|nr:glycosyltransferase [Bacteroidales bacterium]